MIDQYKSKDNWEMAEKFVQLNLKKSRKGKRSWSLYISFLYSWLLSLNDPEKEQEIENKITKTLSRAKQSLNKKEYNFVLIQKAINEFKNGEHERGSTSFQQLVASHPKRTDIWIVYLDMMTKYCDEEDKTRALYNRVISQKIKPKSMKTIFVKYLNFEKSIGNASKINNVKKLASRFIEEQILKRSPGMEGAQEQFQSDGENDEEMAQEDNDPVSDDDSDDGVGI